MTADWNEIGAVVLDAIRPLPCLIRSESCSTTGAAPVDPSADIELLAVVVVAVSILAVLALVVALIALMLGQRGRHLPPAGSRVRRLDDEVPVLPPEAVPVHVGGLSPQVWADRPPTHWG